MLFSAVWMNLLIIFISMGFVAHSPPNFPAAKAAYNLDPGPVHTASFVSLPLFLKVNGIMNMVFAYGGAMIFPEFMAEMRRPMDFWKGMVSLRRRLGVTLNSDIAQLVLCPIAHHDCVHDVRHIRLLLPGTVHSWYRVSGRFQVLMANRRQCIRSHHRYHCCWLVWKHWN